MAKQNRNTAKEVSALILDIELITRENKVLARLIDKLAAARKAGSTKTFRALLAGA
jgi:hypothetical protein